ncbi:MAG: hypothetical protein R3B90_09765 [Planctomycetaceae bacterium]
MDAIKKHKFWILSGLAIVLALVGFFMANPGLQAKTQERITTLKGLQTPNANQENEKFTEFAKKVANDVEKSNADQVRSLDGIQRQWMSWPALIERGLERHAETGQIVYRGETLRDDQIRFQYAREYLKQQNSLYLSFNPVLPTGGPYDKLTRNLVFLERTVLPVHEFPAGETPTIDKIWDAQEDYWILSMIAQAVNDTNSAAQDVTNAPVREIKSIQLFGGTGESTVTAATSGGAESGMEAGYSGTEGAPGSSTTGRVNVAFATGDPSFAPSEEFGSDADTGATAADAGSAVEQDYFGASGAVLRRPRRCDTSDSTRTTPVRSANGRSTCRSSSTSGRFLT